MTIQITPNLGINVLLVDTTYFKGAQMVLLNEGGPLRTSCSVDLVPSHVDELITRLMPMGTYGQNPEDERKQVRLHLERAVGISEASKEEQKARFGFVHSETNVKLAERVATIVKNIVARDRQNDHHRAELNDKIAKLEARIKAFEVAIAGAGLSQEDSPLDQLKTLVKNRQEAMEVLAGQRRM